MKRILFSAIAMVALASTALADTKPSDAEAAKITDALAAWNCTGGEYEKETEASGVFEIDDAKCPGGQYDVKLDSSYSVTSITRD